MKLAELAKLKPAVITPIEAHRQGLKYFFTGVPCGRGHIAPRIIKKDRQSGECAACRVEDGKRALIAQANKRREVAAQREEELVELARKSGKALQGPTNLYRHRDKAGVLLYVGISLDAVTRLRSHLRSSEWALQIATIEVEQFPTREQALAAEYLAIRKESPLWNRMHSKRVPRLADTTGAKVIDFTARRLERSREARTE